MDKLFLKTKETNEGKKYYLSLGLGREEPDFTVLVDSIFVNDDISISFPISASLMQGKFKNSLILVPSDERTVHYIFIDCGYRGESDFNVSSKDISNFSIYKFEEFKISKNSLGISRGALIDVPFDSSFKVLWTKTGYEYRGFEHIPFAKDTLIL